MENILKRLYKIFLLVCLMSVVLISGCSDEGQATVEEKSNQEKLLEELIRPFDASDKESYSTALAVLVGDKQVYVDEAVWYVFLIEDSMRIYSETYEKKVEEPYWEQEVDGGTTMGKLYTDDIITQIAYNKFLAGKALEAGIECDDKEIDEKTEEVWNSVAKEDVDKYGLSKEGYKKMITNLELCKKYIELLGEDLDISEEDLKKDNPKEEFEGKINTEFLIVQNTYIDEEGNKQTKDDETINKLVTELEDARCDVLSGMSMEDVAKKYENVEYYTSSIYKGTNSATSAYENAASKLETGEVSEIVKEALNSYVIKRLDNTKDKDYEEYIEKLIIEKKTAYAENKAKELSETVNVRSNEKVWNCIGVGKNNS